MNRPLTALAAAALFGISGACALAQQGAPAGFGAAPAGSVPLLFNDHHVYAKPDVLRQGRVLAALVRNGTILVPLRSMFEQMGATVSYDASTQTATVAKAGSSVSVTVGKPEVVIDGQSRPLDVPPMLYQGAVMVPVRVISEAMGAYVQWVPDQHVVAIRYVTPTAPPSPPPAPPAPSATVKPTAVPTPTPLVKPYREDVYVAGDYLISPKVYNEFSPGNTGTGSLTARAAAEFVAVNIPWLLEVDYDNWRYPHTCGTAQVGTPNNSPCLVAAIGKGYSTYVPAFSAVNRDADVRLGIRLFKPATRFYIAASYIFGSTNYGYPNFNAIGGGLEKLPDLDQKLSFYGSVFYYPSYHGGYDNSAIISGPTSFNLAYGLIKYQLGLNYVVAQSPFFIDAGWKGLSGSDKANAPSPFTFTGPYLGFGVKISQ